MDRRASIEPESRIESSSVRHVLDSVRSQLYYSSIDYYRGLTRPAWLLMRKFGQYSTVRSIATSRHRGSLLPVDSGAPSLFGEVDVHEVLGSLSCDGLSLGVDLPENTVAEIVEFARETPCYGNRRFQFPMFYATREEAQRKYGKRFGVASYFKTATGCPAIRRLQSDPLLLQVARTYLKTRRPPRIE